MLLSLKTSSVENISKTEFKLNIEIPTVYLDSLKYTVSIRNILLDLNHYITDEVYISLHTTAIDRNSFNPDQEIFSFLAQPGSNFIFYEPYKLREYIIQRRYVHSSEFTLRVNCQHPENFELKSVEFILELKRDARVQ